MNPFWPQWVACKVNEPRRSYLNIYIFDLRFLEKPVEPSVVLSSMNAMDHAKWRDLKTTDAFEDLIGRCYCCDDVAGLKLLIRLPLMQPVMWRSLQGTREK